MYARNKTVETEFNNNNICKNSLRFCLELKYKLRECTFL